MVVLCEDFHDARSLEHKLRYCMSVAASDRGSHLEHRVEFGEESIKDRCILLLLRYAACLMFIQIPSITKPLLFGAFWF